MNATTKDDLDYLRDLAEGGAQAPLLGGRFLTWWGGVITLAYVGHFAILEGIGGLDAFSINWMWLAAIILGLGGFFALIALFPAKPGSGSAGNRAEPVLWRTAGLAIFALFGGILASAFMDKTVLHPDASVPFALGVYAIGLATTGALAGNRVLSLASVGALVGVAVTAALYQTSALYLAAAIAVFTTVFLPGLLLLRNEPRSVV